jgi:hypothetical protein
MKESFTPGGRHSREGEGGRGGWSGKAQPYRTAGAVGAGGRGAELVRYHRFFHTFTALPHGGQRSCGRGDGGVGRVWPIFSHLPSFTGRWAAL